MHAMMTAITTTTIALLAFVALNTTCGHQLMMTINSDSKTGVCGTDAISSLAIDCMTTSLNGSNNLFNHTVTSDSDTKSVEVTCLSDFTLEECIENYCDSVYTAMDCMANESAKICDAQQRKRLIAEINSKIRALESDICANFTKNDAIDGGLSDFDREVVTSNVFEFVSLDFTERVNIVIHVERSGREAVGISAVIKVVVFGIVAIDFFVFL